MLNAWQRSKHSTGMAAALLEGRTPSARIAAIVFAAAQPSGGMGTSFPAGRADHSFMIEAYGSRAVGAPS
jgi:hypothetical protein